MPATMNLTLPEKKLLCQPDTPSLHLLEYALIELLAKGGLKYSQGASFLKICPEHPIFEQKVYAFVKQAFGPMPQFQPSRFLKVIRENLKGDLDAFKTLVWQSLHQERGLATKSFWGRYTLTEKGQQYRQGLDNTQNILHLADTEAFPPLTSNWKDVLAECAEEIGLDVLEAGLDGIEWGEVFSAIDWGGGS